MILYKRGWACFRYILFCSYDDSYSINLLQIVLKVTDVNDNPPTLLINKFYLMVPEDDNFTFSVGQFVIDNDTDVNRVAVWSLNGDEGMHYYWYPDLHVQLISIIICH